MVHYDNLSGNSLWSLCHYKDLQNLHAFQQTLHYKHSLAEEGHESSEKVYYKGWPELYIYTQ